MSQYIHGIKDEKKVDISSVGGKWFNIVELSKISGIKVPDGFCITTNAFKEAFSQNKELNSLFEQLSSLSAIDIESIKTISTEIENVIKSSVIPGELAADILEELGNYGDNLPYAVRSSATLEDLPTDSFAGQHDTFLNVIGNDAILGEIKKCWASLYTERAITYRIQKGYDHRKVSLAVIVQRMILPDSSGVLFTTDPITSNRKVVSIDAGYGIGESTVSGIVNPDMYKVMEEEITDKKISSKKNMISALKDGGTDIKLVDPELVEKQILSDEQIMELSTLGRKIEAYFGSPQDIEWALLNNNFYFLQSRAITTLFPLAENPDGKNHIYLSSGHMQMMTDPIKPLGMSFYKSVLGGPPSREIGGRMYVDMTHDLATPLGRVITKSFLGMVGDDLITDSIAQIIKNRKLIKSLPKGRDKVIKPEKSSNPFAIMFNAYKIYKKNDPEIVANLIANEDKAIESMKEKLEKLSGDEVFEFIELDHENRRAKLATPEGAGVLTAVLLSEKWLSKKVEKWTGIKNAADTFLMSIPNSITAETGFALLDVADRVRNLPEIIDYLSKPDDETFFEDIEGLEGGEEVCSVIKNYLLKYGMRCSGDIDITVPRWSEKPSNIASVILSNIDNFEPGASKRKFNEGLIEADRRIEEIVHKIEKLPWGRRKARKVRRIAELVRNYIGYREYPKFSYIKRYYIYKMALHKEASRLIDKGIVRNIEDVHYLYFDEFRDAVNKNFIDYNIIERRREEYKKFENLTPPRVITSDGEVVTGTYNQNDIPENCLPGIAVSSGLVEGRARIVSSFEDAELKEGDILVTEFTDPSWTPLFVSIKGLVTEVGGLITHGAIIAREYGLPAVVSVENATKLIKDGQMIRVNGTEGYIEILS